MCDYDAEEMWFLRSISRYKQISMFDLEYVVTHLEQTDKEHVCIVGHYEHNNKDEIVEVILPKKLLVDEEQEGLERDGDLKIERGGFATSQIFQVKAVANERKIISSEEDKFGVSIYDLGSESDGVITRLHEYSCEHLEPWFSFNGMYKIIMATTNEKPLTVIDILTGQVIQTTSLRESPGSEPVNMLQPEFMTQNVSAICNKNTGAVHIKDTRVDKDAINVFNVSNHSSAMDLNQLWTISSPFQSTTISHYSGDVKFACVSTGGQFMAYDVRSSKQIFYSAINNKSNVGTLNSLSLKVTPDFRRFAVSGYDEKVYVHDIDENGDLDLVFTHDGHRSMTNESGNVVKCHMFLKDDLLLSADDTMSLHCWKFVPNT